MQIDRELKLDQKVEMVVNKTNKMLGLIRRSFTYLDGSTMKKLYTSLVRPILEYDNVAWASVLVTVFIYGIRLSQSSNK